MDILIALILGVVEGVTEFLPISSTGHLILAGKLLGIITEGFWGSFDVAIQLGAIMAVLSLYGRQLATSKGLVARIAAAFVPTAIIGFIAYDRVRVLLGQPEVVLWALGVGGLALIVLERSIPEPAEAGEDLSRLPYGKAVAVGIAQSLAIVPGVSRAAATVMAGLALGLSRRAIVEFSFLLAIPTMGAATALDLLHAGGGFTAREWGILVVGFLAAWATAYGAIRWLLRFVTRHDFTWFGVYRVLLAVLLALVLF
jgi:undecaprenyl-diphosphatase